MNTNFTDKDIKKTLEDIMKHKFFKPALALAVLVIAALSFQVMTSQDVSGQDESGNAATPAAPAATATAETPAGSQAWQIRCNKDGNPEKPEKGKCEVVQRLTVKETGQRFAEMAVGYPADSKDPRGVMILPLGVLLENGALLQIDDNEPFKFSPRYCDPNGCVAFLNMQGKLLDMMRKGEKVTLTMQTADGKNLSVAMTLDGFAKLLKDVD